MISKELIYKMRAQREREAKPNATELLYVFGASSLQAKQGVRFMRTYFESICTIPVQALNDHLEKFDNLNEKHLRNQITDIAKLRDAELKEFREKLEGELRRGLEIAKKPLPGWVKKKIQETTESQDLAVETVMLTVGRRIAAQFDAAISDCNILIGHLEDKP